MTVAVHIGSGTDLLLKINAELLVSDDLLAPDRLHHFKNEETTHDDIIDGADSDALLIPPHKQHSFHPRTPQPRIGPLQCAL